MNLNDFNLPSLSTRKRPEQETQEIKNYLYGLTDALQHILSNLSLKENLQRGELTSLKNDIIAQIPAGGGGSGGESDGTVSANVSKTGTVAVITITDASGTTVARVYDGKDGYTPQKGVDYFDGEKGDPGNDGVGVSTIEQTTTSTEDGGENVVTVTKTDGSTSTFSVRNGSKGSPGEPGEPGQPGPAGPKAGPTLLWSGTWSSGSIDVPGSAGYTLFFVDIDGSSTKLMLTREGERIRGSQSFTTSANQTYLETFSATTSGDTWTYAKHLLRAFNASNAVSISAQDSAVLAIYGVL